MNKRSRSAQALRDKAERLLARANDMKQAAATAERAALTHKKIVIGAWVLSEFGLDLSLLPDEVRERLSQYVKRKHDRRALGLPVLEETPN